MIIQEPVEWSKEDLQSFYTALDCLDEAIRRTGATESESADILAVYFEQKRARIVPSDKVLDRMANAMERWNNKPASTKSPR